MFNFNKIDFIGIGDIVTDAFIELDNAWIETDNPKKEEELCMKFGEKLPFKQVTVIPGVGNSANACVAAHRLGLSSALISHVGNDAFGEEQILSLKKSGVKTRYISTHKNISSNYHYVLQFGAERTILVKHSEFPYSLPKIPQPKFIYLSSLAKNSLKFHQDITEYLKHHPGVKLAFQPGTFQIKLGYDSIKELYKHTFLFFCNKQEAQSILNSQEEELSILLQKLHELGPQIPIVTDGPNGAYALYNNKVLFVPPYPDPKEPIDRTGAGDSFASAITSALALGIPFETALLWGPINSMSVVQQLGAQAGLLSREELETYLKNAPESYKVNEI